MKERTFIAFRLISTHLLIIPLLLVSSVFLNTGTYLIVSISQTVLFIIFFTGYWEFFGLRFRDQFFVLMEFLILIVAARRILLKGSLGSDVVILAVLILIQLLLLFVLAKILIVIFLRDKKSFEITFPFRNGRYMITDGGNSKISRVMNYHFHSTVHKKKKTNYSMLYATDMVKIDPSAARFMPQVNNDYPIFGESVYSPVSGIVFKVENSIEDNIPFSGGYPYNTGNTVVIRSENRYMLLGHLKKGSVRVLPGETVSAGDLLAEAGNSGMSERPHIHIQLIESNTESYWNGIGLAILYRNKNLFKNRILDII